MKNEYRLILDNIFNLPRNYKIPNQLRKDTAVIINDLYLKVIPKNDIIFKTGSFVKGLGPIKESENYKDIPIEIRQDIISSKYVNVLHKFTLNSGRLVNLYFIYENYGNLNELYKKIIIWLSYLDNIASTKCSTTLTIYLLLCPNKKVLPLNRTS